MDQHLFILLFFTGVAPFVLSVSRRYFLNQNGKTWIDAQAYCQAKYTDLAVIKDDDDVVQIQKEAQRQQFSSSAWIGLYNDINSWRWSFGNEPLGNIKNWLPGQPSNKDGNQTCVTIVPNGWDDRDCAVTSPFICFNEITYKYIYISTIMTWYEAQSYCRQHYTDLAIARNETEISVVQGLQTPSSYYVWIGLFRDSWKWIDQTNFSTITWVPGKPDNALGNEDCGSLSNIQVEDDQCSSVKPFFCFSEVKKQQQFIRITVQSNQDVNELKAAIFDQIDQKLKDNGMQDKVTMKWRAQKDGMVFHKN